MWQGQWQKDSLARILKSLDIINTKKFCDVIINTMPCSEKGFAGHLAQVEKSHGASIRVFLIGHPGPPGPKKSLPHHCGSLFPGGVVSGLYKKIKLQT